MSITPSPVTIGNIFNKRYAVDFYQREYKWNDKQQSFAPIKSLLDDIFYRFDLNYKPGMDVNEKYIASFDWYYLNSFMVNSVGGNTFIVDGQQRLTTLTLIIINLYHLTQNFGINTGVQRFLANNVCGFTPTGEEEFWMGFEDRSRALKNVFEHGLDGKTKHQGALNVSEKNIYEAFETIHAYLVAKISDAPMFEAFRLYLFQRVMLIEISVDDSKDVAMAFEVINDRGIPLKAYEILKGKILGIIDKNEVDGYVTKWDESMLKISSSFDEKFIDDFFSTYFRSKFADSTLQYRDLETDRFHKSIYLDEFNKKIGFKHDNDPLKEYIGKVKTFVMDELPYFSELYSHIMADCFYGDSKNEHVLFNEINEQDTQFYILMSAISNNDPEKDAKYKEVVKYFDRYYTLLNLTGSYKSNTFNESIIQLGIRIRNKDIATIKTEFDQLLLAEVKKAHNRNDLTEAFKYELFSGVGYNHFSARFLRYFFARVDHFISVHAKLPTSSYEQMIRRDLRKNIHHIEHVLTNHPQNLSLFADEGEFNVHRNRLGGLLLLKGRDNESSNNELYPQKLKTYSGNGTLFAQTLRDDFYKSNIGFEDFVKTFNLPFKPYSHFDKAAIEERQLLLYEICKIIWEVN